MIDRRKFLKTSIITFGASLIVPQVLNGGVQKSKNSKIRITENDIILFQGDSITDHRRNREITSANQLNAMGQGYAMVASSSLLNRYADKNIQIYNRGISGNKIPQLQSRWQEDCLDLQPTILSILIGVNDYWHKRDGRYEGTAGTFTDGYRRLLDQTLSQLPKVQLIIGEPFVVQGVKYVDETWFPDFGKYQKAARDIANEYDASFIPYQSIFDSVENKASGDYWTTDGIHTTLAGINLMAEAWLSCVE